jgi:hypothetical protein
MAKPIALTPPITGKAAIAFNEKADRISRGEITDAERKAEDELFDRVFASYRPSTAPRRIDTK